MGKGAAITRSAIRAMSTNKAATVTPPPTMTIPASKAATAVPPPTRRANPVQTLQIQQDEVRPLDLRDPKEEEDDDEDDEDDEWEWDHGTTVQLFLFLCYWEIVAKEDGFGFRPSMIISQLPHLLGVLLQALLGSLFTSYFWKTAWTLVCCLADKVTSKTNELARSALKILANE